MTHRVSTQLQPGQGLRNHMLKLDADYWYGLGVVLLMTTEVMIRDHLSMRAHMLSAFISTYHVEHCLTDCVNK